MSIPNPDYPQPINNLTGNVAYKVNGKNILQISSTYNNRGITSTYNQNTGYITSTGTTTSSYPRINDIQVNMPAGTTVTLSSDLSSYTAYVRFYRDDSNYEQVSTTSDDTRTRTLGYDINRLMILINAPTDTEINETYYLQLEKGSEVTSFEPYISQTFNIPLGDIELGETTTYEDKIYSSNGRFYLEKNCGSNIFDNATQVNAVNDISSSPIDISLNGTYSIPKYTLNTDIKNDMMYCTIAKYEYNSIITDNRSAQTYLNNNTMCMRQGTNDRIYFKNSVFTGKTGTEIKGLIEGEKLYYVLATPTTTEITQENYPALYNALKQIQDYLTSYKINKEFILGYSSPEIEY